MIKKDCLSRLWKRTVWHLLIVDAIAIGVLVSLVLDRSKTNSGPEYTFLAAIFAALTVASVVFYWIARSIRDNIGKRYGED